MIALTPMLNTTIMCNVNNLAKDFSMGSLNVRSMLKNGKKVEYLLS